MRTILISTSLLIAACTAQLACAQPGGEGSALKHEFRGAWIATVLNLDWPSARGLETTAQQGQLVAMLDALKEAGINAVFFQVRSESDAMYASEIEPWSYWLTGEQGRAPEPFYDPLAFAIDEAHKRGMELHAWFNPYRAVRNTNGYTQDAAHVSVQHPDWTLAFGTFLILDPGLPDVRDYVTRVIMDVVRRYDLDGVHFDDFFYPYPPNAIANEDAFTFAAHDRGFADVGDWRRDNVNLFVAQVQDSIRAAKPWVKFGISPFGIWRDGTPAGITGLDAYSVIYADATAWLSAETIDYLVPQLYWAFGGGQDYARLAPWWASVRNERHLYTGHGLYRSDPNTFGNTLFAADEVPRQVRFNREDSGILGSVFFRAKNITAFSSMGFADSLKSDLFATPALTPPMAWKDNTPPAPPEHLAFTWTGTEELTLDWQAPTPSDTLAATRRYAVYRMRSATEPDAATVIADARNLLAVTGETHLTDYPGQADDPYYYMVTAVSANAIESAPSNFVSAEGRAVAVERAEPAAFTLYQNYPNPFNPDTAIPYSLHEPARVTLRVYNVLGQVVATLVDDAWKQIGGHSARWDGRAHDGQSVSSGTYFYMLDIGGRRVVKAMVLVK